jgi:hypothetical protein
MAAKFFTGLPLDGPDPECVRGFGEQLLAERATDALPKPTGDHSHRTSPPRPRGSAGPVPLTLSIRRPDAPPAHACAESPLAGFTPTAATACACGGH